MSKTTNSTKKVNNNNSKYAGGAYNSKKPISGPGIWITCVRHMEKRCVPEMYNLLEDVSSFPSPFFHCLLFLLFYEKV